MLVEEEYNSVIPAFRSKAGGPRVPDQPDLHSEILSLKKKDVRGGDWDVA